MKPAAPAELDGRKLDDVTRARLAALIDAIAKSDPARSADGVLAHAIDSLRPTIRLRAGVWVSRPWYFVGDADGPPIKLTT